MTFTYNNYAPITQLPLWGHTSNIFVLRNIVKFILVFVQRFIDEKNYIVKNKIKILKIYEL